MVLCAKRILSKQMDCQGIVPSLSVGKFGQWNPATFSNISIIVVRGGSRKPSTVLGNTASYFNKLLSPLKRAAQSFKKEREPPILSSSLEHTLSCYMPILVWFLRKFHVTSDNTNTLMALSKHLSEFEYAFRSKGAEEVV
jgi:hypothetical protein